MKNPKSLIIKIALGISIAAFIFSAVTLVRNIIIGAMVFLSIIQLLGSGVIVIICIALYRSFKELSGDDDAQDTDDSAEDPAVQLPDTGYAVDDDINYTPEDDFSNGQSGYNLHLFDEE